ncbi:hypothetical protein FNH22_28645 [Fulvivirga sp. M361]|uniref:WD40 repeat domain-containing protein n=1 Tax=Fulvivirga sp. M361 TaxID=2594266 RepID=UPI00117BCF31|nr:hypothetical protein [Fulvivirga sp. M361]TRX48566.1 hypothetical protein FNH22_28645 [Fulvivirga sp. M361]
MIKSIGLSSLFSLLSYVSLSQGHYDYQLRLEPVWSRVADVFGEAGSVESAEFSRDGKFIVSGTKYDNSVIMWRTSDGTEIWRQYAAQEIERVGWSADDKYVAACSEDFLVTVYSAASGEIILKLPHQNGIDGLTWSNTGSLVVSGEEEIKNKKGSKEAFIRVFEVPSGREIKAIDFGGTINELFFSADDRYLLATGHGGIKIYNTSDWSLLQTLEADTYMKFITGVFSPDSKYVFAGANDGHLYLWEWQSGKLLKKFSHTGKKVETVSWHPNGNYLLFAGHDPYIRVYRVEEVIAYKNDRIPLAHKVWAGDHAEYIDFNNDGSFLVSAHQNGLIKLWAWMGEDPSLNERRHKNVKVIQKEHMKSK